MSEARYIVLTPSKRFSRRDRFNFGVEVKGRATKGAALRWTIKYYYPTLRSMLNSFKPTEIEKSSALKSIQKSVEMVEAAASSLQLQAKLLTILIDPALKDPVKAAQEALEQLDRSENRIETATDD